MSINLPFFQALKCTAPCSRLANGVHFQWYTSIEMAQNSPANQTDPPILHLGWVTWGFDLFCAAYLVAQLGWTPPGWCLPALIGFGAFAVLQSLLLPIQNKVALLVLLGGLGGAMEWGLLQDGSKALVLGVTCLFTLAGTRTALQYLSRLQRSHHYYGFWLLGATALFGSLQITAVLSILAKTTISFPQWGLRALMALGILLVATPYFIPKRPAPRTWRPDALHLWVSSTLVFAITVWKQGHGLLGLLLLATLTVLGLVGRTGETDSPSA